MVPRKRRSKEQILYHILSLCKGNGANKTKIVYALNLNFGDSGIFLKMLVKNGLLEAGQGHAPPYKTTQKGVEILAHFKSIREQIPELCD